MKTIANRLIVFAASAIALGTVAFGQTRPMMIAEIPFAFHTVVGTLPAGNYEIRETPVGGAAHVVSLWNTATQKGAFAGNPTYNAYRKASAGTVLEFVCVERNCSLKAIRSVDASLEYATPSRIKDDSKVAVISIPVKLVNAD
jgi:hypothetical protein